MDIPWGSRKAQKFITNAGFITSFGPHDHNIMSAEWTHHISYSPGLIAVCLGFRKATLENIRKTKEFGVNLASTDQNVLSSVAGGYTGREYDKVEALKELGFSFRKAKKIKPLMVEGAAMAAECKLANEIALGDHVMLVGEVLYATASERQPAAYHQGMYWRLTETVEKPSQEERSRIKSVVEKHRKQGST